MKAFNEAATLLLILSSTALGCGGITSDPITDEEPLVAAEDANGREASAMGDVESRPNGDGQTPSSAGGSSGMEDASSCLGAGLAPSDGQARELGTPHELLLGPTPTCDTRYDCDPDDYYIEITGELGHHVLRYPYDDAAECMSEPYLAPFYSPRKGQMTAVAACAGPGDMLPCILIVSVPDGLDAVELLGNCGAAWRLDHGTVTSGSLRYELERLAEAELDVSLIDRVTGNPRRITIQVRACRWFYDH